MFFVSYALIASFLIFNLFIGLFIGIVLNSIEEARSAEADIEKTHRDDR